MTQSNRASRVKCTPEQVDEAAVWMTLLHASNRSEQTDRGFRRWLAAHPAHATAFEKVSIAHELTAGLPRGPLPRLSRWQRAGFRAGAIRASLAVAAIFIFMVLSGLLYWRSSGVGTAVGEQRTLTLSDGSQIFLNTATRIVVRYDKQRRLVELKEGEALFDVAKSAPDWPFTVRAGGREITALGTSFVVRRNPEDISVTMMEGKVSVSPMDDSNTTPGDARTLVAGERATFSHAKMPKIDRPPLEKVAAWRYGHVEFDKVPLADAVKEMNRYSRTQLSFERPETGRIPITGIFKAGASESFASAVAAAYRLQVIENKNLIVLSGVPGPSNQPATPENILSTN